MTFPPSSIEPSKPDLATLVNAQHPWLGLLPYKEEHRDYFFGRDREVEDILGRIRDNSLTILYGQSGLGKSSLLAAGVSPRLKENGFSPKIIRLSYSKRTTLREQMLANLPNHPPFIRSADDQSWLPWKATLWELFHRKTSLTSEHRIPVLIFDQFEEIFTLGGQPEFENQVADWLEQMADLLQNRPPRQLAERFAKDHALAEQYHFGDAPVRIVFTLREDYLAQLERWKAQLPLLMQNRMALTLLNGPQARQAVLGPAQLGDHSLVSREVAESIVRTVARVPGDTPLDQIKAVPPLLSLLCEQLNAARFTPEGEHPQITAESVRDQADDILQRFYEDSFLSFPQEHRSRIRALLEDPPMITEGGYRNTLVREDAEAQLTRAGVTDAKTIFDTLIQRRLITAETRDQVQRLEITHDVLVPLLLRSRKERQDREAKEQAEHAVVAAKAEKERLAKERRRLRFVVVGVSFLALAAGALAAWALKAQRVAEASNREARTQASLAFAAQRAAEASKTQAAAQRDEARYNEGLAWLLRAEVADERSHRYPDTLLYAAQAIGFEGVGRPPGAELPLRYIPAGLAAFTKATKWIAVRPSYRPVWASPLQQSAVTAMCLSPSGRLLSLAHADGRVVQWDLNSGKESSVLIVGAVKATDLAFDPAEQTLAIATADGVQLYDLGKRSAATTHPGEASAVAWSPGGEILAAAGATGLTLWRGEKRQSIAADLLPPVRLAFSVENSIIAAAYPGQGVRVFFPHAGTAANAWMTHRADATSVAISPDGARIAIGTADGAVSLWSSADATLLGMVPEELRHRGDHPEVLDLAFRPDGHQLASASADSTIKLWDVNNDIPRVTATLCGHNSAVVRVSYAPGGELLASAGEDGSARLWCVEGKPESQSDWFMYLDRHFYAFHPVTQQMQWAGGSGFVGPPPHSALVVPNRADLIADAQQAAKENRWHRVDLRLKQLKSLGADDADDAAILQLTSTRSGFGKEGHSFTNTEGMNLLWCPPTDAEGFLMGSPAAEKDRNKSETQHKIILTGFWLGQYEVTQKNWKDVMGNEPSANKTSGIQAPVENISWSEADEFCRRLTDLERARGTLPAGWGYALPSEAQWEYACRAGNNKAYSFGDNPERLHLHGNYNDKSGGFPGADTEYDDHFERTAPVGTYKPNAWGFYDMHGNVWEWCADALDFKEDGSMPSYHADPLTKTIDPLGEQGSRRVNRGGGWFASPDSCRSARRSADEPFKRFNSLGFRPAVISTRPVDASHQKK